MAKWNCSSPANGGYRMAFTSWSHSAVGENLPPGIAIDRGRKQTFVGMAAGQPDQGGPITLQGDSQMKLSLHSTRKKHRGIVVSRS